MREKAKQILVRHMGQVVTLALLITTTVGFGEYCRGWLYQPEVPKD